MYSKNNDMENAIYDNADKVIKKFFESLLNRCQVGSEISMRDGDFIFDCAQLMY